MKKIKVDKYIKFNSFHSFETHNGSDDKEIIEKIILLSKDQTKISKFSEYQKKIIFQALNDLTNQNDNEKNDKFKLKQISISELGSLGEEYYLDYIFHRYRYEIFPKKKIIDEYPPCLQIEPSSICNYRCVFCFETDKSFTNKKNGFMGTMNINVFKQIIDKAYNNIQFITLASRGEPLVSKSFIKMLKYTENKFLNLKLNTNASLMTEEICHAILSDTVKTLVISADAADENLYKKIRVNGTLKKVLKNIELFNNIKEKHYKNSKIITRVSGVKFSKEQDFDSMVKLWKNLVDQVAFVQYNPWENCYLAPETKIKDPCSDLWRRMFIWWDGKINPCDVDYKSNLSIGQFKEKNLNFFWNSKKYNDLRKLHLNKSRNKITPCKSCSLI